MTRLLVLGATGTIGRAVVVATFAGDLLCQKKPRCIFPADRPRGLRDFAITPFTKDKFRLPKESQYTKKETTSPGSGQSRAPRG
jgi:hypothetical protein